MRRFTLLMAIVAFSFPTFSQNIYIQFDAQCMDKLEYRFVQPESNNMSYTAYRLNKNENEKLYFETGIESVMIKKTIIRDTPFSEFEILNFKFEFNVLIFKFNIFQIDFGLISN